MTGCGSVASVLTSELSSSLTTAGILSLSVATSSSVGGSLISFSATENVEEIFLNILKYIPNSFVAYKVYDFFSYHEKPFFYTAAEDV